MENLCARRNQRKQKEDDKKGTKEALEEAVIDYYVQLEKEKANIKTFNVCFGEWAKRQKLYGIANSTFKNYQYEFNKFFKNTDFGEKNIKFINEEDITIFVIQTIKTFHLRKTQATEMLAAVGGVFKYARTNRLIHENPFDFVDTRSFKKFYNLDRESNEERFLSDEEMAQLIHAADCYIKTHPDTVLPYAVKLATMTGMRLGELSGLMWDDIDEKKGVITIRHSEKRDTLLNKWYISTTKTQKERQFPLHDKLIDLFKEIKKVEMSYGYLGEFVFMGKHGKTHNISIDKCIRRMCQLADIPVKSISDVRRTVNSRLKQAGVSTTVAAALLGHTADVNDNFYTYDTSNMEYKKDALLRII